MNNKEFKVNLNILKEIVRRNVKNQYRNSFLGVLWTLLNPFLTMAVMSIVFSNIFKSSSDIINYPIYLLTGTIFFSLFRQSTETGLTGIVGNSDLIKKVKVPYSLFPISAVFSSLVNFGFSLFALVIMMLILKQPIYPSFLMVFVWLPSIVLFSIGVALILSSIYVFFRDIQHIYSVFLTLLMYLTPLFYSVEVLSPRMQQIMKYNPMYHYLKYFRQVIQMGTVPSWTAHLICFGGGILMLLLGILVFNTYKKKFVLFI